MAANSKSARTFRENVLVVMAEAGITITDVAESIGMSRPGLSRVLNGHEDLTLSRAERIATYLKQDLADLLVPKKVRQPA